MGKQTNGGHELEYRADIDGLRAIAVTSVVLFHAAPSLVSSGFVGVDVFFVISGYLIGGIIFAAAMKRRFSFAEFYARRARRILPALIAVATSVGLVSIFYFSVNEMLEFAGQAALSLVGASNFYFWEHTDYFATNSDQEPLLMTWSLGVEEQFYVIFPFIMMFVARIGKNIRFAVLIGIIIASLIASLYLTDHHPITAFYMLPSRGWEMGLGALLAVLHYEFPSTIRANGARTQAGGLIAACGLIGSLVLFDGSTAFPGVAALLPVLATLGLIQTRHSLVNRRILSTSPFVFVGKISYSWYLWHWPLMALVRRAADEPPSEPQMLCIAGLSFVLGVLSWRFVEQPFRKRSRPANSTLWRYGVALCAALALPAGFKLSHGWPGRLPEAVLTTERVQREGRGNCLVPFESESLLDEDCYPAGATIALMGDSHASAFGPGLIKAAEARGLKVAQVSKSSCPPLLGYGPSDPQRPMHLQQCANFQRAAIDRIVNDPSIRLVFVSGFWPAASEAGFFKTTPNDVRPVDLFTALREGLSALSRSLDRAQKRMVIVGDVPRLSFNPPGHLIGDELPLRRMIGRLFDGQDRARSDVASVDRSNRDYEPTRAFLARLANDLDVQFFDPQSQICDGHVCRYAQGPVPLYYDAHHLSAAGSRTINWNEAIGLGW